MCQLVFWSVERENWIRCDTTFHCLFVFYCFFVDEISFFFFCFRTVWAFTHTKHSSDSTRSMNQKPLFLCSNQCRWFGISVAVCVCKRMWPMRGRHHEIYTSVSVLSIFGSHFKKFDLISLWNHKKHSFLLLAPIFFSSFLWLRRCLLLFANRKSIWRGVWGGDERFEVFTFAILIALDDYFGFSLSNKKFFQTNSSFKISTKPLMASTSSSSLVFAIGIENPFVGTNESFETIVNTWDLDV